MSTKKLITISALLAIGLYLTWLIYSEWEKMEIGMKFVVTFFIAVTLGLFTVIVLLPIVADKIGAFFFSAPEVMEATELTKAAAKVTQGDYEGAIKAYKAIAQDEPDNRFPIFEIAKIHYEHLDDIDSAIKTFEDSLESKEWPENDAAAMMFRLQQIYLEDKQDEDRPRKYSKRSLRNFLRLDTQQMLTTD